jgi:hypothetical protein
MPRLVLFFLAATAVALIGQSAALHAGEDKYRVGDRLQQPGAKGAGRVPYQNVSWEALIPEGWDPAQSFRGMDFGRLGDSDQRAIDALARLRKAWDEAPVEPAWNGKRIRIPGFVVPLERRNDDDVTEFLLVPYFGACIHVPPPPANQIIHVFPAKPVKKLRTMDAVWVIGVLDTSRSEALKGAETTMGMGVAGYRMKAEQIEPYKEGR